MAEEIYMTKEEYASENPGVVKEAEKALEAMACNIAGDSYKFGGEEPTWFASQEALNGAIQTANNAQASATVAQTMVLEKVSKSEIVQDAGTSETLIMSQKAVTDALAEIGTVGSVVLQSIMSAIYPVDSIYMSTNDTNPGELFGGTWEAWGSGKVPVGVDANDSDFNSSGKTGGVKNVTLTAAQSGIQNHKHTFTGTAVTSGRQSVDHTHTISGGKHSHAENYNSWINAKGNNYVSGGASGYYLNTVTTGREQVYTYEASISLTCGNNSANHTHSVTAAGTISDTSANATAAHSNLQPYITCYMWKRVA